MTKDERLLERNTKILNDYKNLRDKKTSIKDSLAKIAEKYYLSTHLINQIVHNPKRNHSPLKQNQCQNKTGIAKQ